MGISGAAVNMATQAMNVVSSVFSRGANAASFMSAVGIGNVVGKIINFLAGFFYFVCKWILFIVDVIFAYVQQLAGMNMSFDSLSGLLSKDSDIVFNLLFSNSAMVTVIIKNLIVIALILIIIFSIFAVIKTQFDSVKNGKADSSVRVLKSTMKAIVLLILTPLIAIFGIIASNLILQSLYMATNTGQSSSLGTQIFLSASTSANNYRNYAKEGVRIPITYNFEKEQEIYDHYDSSVDEEFVEYLNSSDNAIYATYLTFTTDNFLSYKGLKDTNSSSENNLTNLYYSIYDIPETQQLTSTGKDDKFVQYRKIENYAVEYYVMADVVEYAIGSLNPLYFKTIEETLDSIVQLYNIAGPGTQMKDSMLNIFNNVVSKYHITFIDDGDREMLAGPGQAYENYIDVFNSRDCRLIRYYSTFLEPNTDGEPEIVSQIQYNHVMGETDELFGAKFIMAVESTIDFNGYSYKYFEPLSTDYSGKSRFSFSSDYSLNGVIPAKGIFEASDYPTAIRKGIDNSIEFYRERLQITVLGDPSDVATFNWSMGGGGFLSNMITMLRAIFNPSSLLPNFDLDNDLSESIRNSYSKDLHVEKSIEAGRMHIGYLFNGGITSLLTNDLYNMSISNFFNLYSLNFLLLVVGSILLIGTCFKAMMALIQRAYDLFLVILVYPTACATIPLENVGVAGGYKNWVDTYVRKLFSTYGVILGLNFVLMLFPIIQGIDFFTPENVIGNKAILRIGNLFFGLLSINQITSLLNTVVRILFELVAFTLIKTIPQVIGKIVGAEELNGNVLTNTINAFKKFSNVAKNIIPTNLVFTIGSKVVNIGKKVKDMKEEGFGNIFKRLLPMSNMAEQIKNQKYLKEKKKKQKEAMEDLKESMMEGASRDEVEKKMKAYQEAQKKYSEAVKAAAKDAGAGKGEGHSLEQIRQKDESTIKAQKKEEKDTGVSSREDDDLDENGIDESLKSKRELKKDKRKAKKYLKQIEKREKQGKELSEEQQQAKETYTKLQEAASEELDSRKSGKADFKKRKREVEELKRRGNLTPEEQQKVKAFDEEELKKSKKARKAGNKAQKQQLKKTRKERAEARKQEEKKQKDMAKDKELFSSRGKKRKQKKKLNQLENEAITIESRLKLSGFKATFKDISKMDPNRVKDIIKDPKKYGVTPEQVKLIQGYFAAGSAADKKKFSDQLTKTGFGVTIDDVSQLSQTELQAVMMNASEFGITDEQQNALNEYTELNSYRSSLVDMNSQAYLSHERLKTRKKQVRDRKAAGYGGINAFKRGRRKSLTKQAGNIDADVAELGKIEDELAKTGTSGADYARTAALRKRKAELEARIERLQGWGQINNREFRRSFKKNKRYERSARRYLEENEEEVSPENIERVAKSMQRRREAKKKKGKK